MAPKSRSASFFFAGKSCFPLLLQAAALALCLFSARSEGAVTIYIFESGGAVRVVSDGGGLNTSAFRGPVQGGYDSIAPDNSLVTVFNGYGISSSVQDSLSVMIEPPSPIEVLGVPGPQAAFTTRPDFELGYVKAGDGQIVVPSNYVSGAPIHLSLTLAGGTKLSDFGFAANATWGVSIPVPGGGRDTMIFTTVPQVPEPGSLMLLTPAAAAALTVRRRRAPGACSAGY